MPARLVWPAATALPLGELATAVALIMNPMVGLGAAAALVLTMLFIGAIGVTLARGKSTGCHCFGNLHAALIGHATILRNSVLGGVAGLVGSEMS